MGYEAAELPELELPRSHLEAARQAVDSLGHAIKCLVALAKETGFDTITPTRTRDCLLWLALKMDDDFEAASGALAAMEKR